MYNHQNYFVKFEWQSINTGNEMAFSIRPAKGNSLFCLFDLDIPLFVCSALSHILSVYHKGAKNVASISHMIL